MSGGLVIGVGRRDRGDDGVGPAVAAAVAHMMIPGVVVTEQAEPSGLLDAWAGAGLVVVADAIRSGQRPGTVHVLHASGRPLPAWAGAGGTHGFGVAEAVELGRALGRLPPELVIVGVEAEQCRLGEPLSETVRAAVATAARVAADVVRGPAADGGQV